MLGKKLFNPPKKTKFHYIPRHYKKETQEAVLNSIGDGKFAQNYIAKKMQAAGLEDSEKRIDFTSYRNKAKASSFKPKTRLGLYLVLMLIIILMAWLLTSNSFSSAFTNG